MPVARFSLSPARRLAPLAAALALIGAATGARAQSLQELYDAARGYDATYLAARALADSAQYRAEQVHALRRPKLDAKITAGQANSFTPTQDVTSRSKPEVGLTAGQTLFSRANDATIEQADKSLESARADLELAEQDLIVRLSQAYFDVLAAQDTLAAAQANKRAISEQLASAKRSFEVGTATITDTREAQARFDLATAQELQADNDLRTKRVALDQLVGRANVQPRPLATPIVLPKVPGNVDEWVGFVDNSAGVRKARVGYEVAQLETEKARAGHLPTVDWGATIKRSQASTSGQSLGRDASTDGRAGSYTVGINLNIPLYAGSQVQNRIRETLLLEEQSRNNLEAQRRGSAQATRQAFLGTQSLQAQVAALEAAEASSQLALEATQLGYKVGVRVNLDVLNAQTQLFNTRRDLAQARYNTLITTLKLRQAAGTLKPEDVNAVDRLIAR